MPVKWQPEIIRAKSSNLFTGTKLFNQKTNKMKNNYYLLAAAINTSLDNLYLIKSIEVLNQKHSIYNIMYTYDMFELNEQLN